PPQLSPLSLHDALPISSGNATISTTTSIFKGASGTSTLTIEPGGNACVNSFGGNYDTAIGHYLSSAIPPGNYNIVQATNTAADRSEEHTSELQSPYDLV